MLVTRERTRKRLTRHRRLRKKVHGTAERPRLAVFRSEKHIYCQLIDDDRRVTLGAASTRSRDLTARLEKTTTIAAAREVGRVIGAKAIQLGLKQLVFDRGGFRYHGRVRALAEGAREAFKEAGEAGF